MLPEIGPVSEIQPHQPVTKSLAVAFGEARHGVHGGHDRRSRLTFVAFENGLRIPVPWNGLRSHSRTSSFDCSKPNGHARIRIRPWPVRSLKLLRHMTDSVTSAAEIALARHSPASLRDLATTLGSYVPPGGNSHEEWVRRVASVWNEPASAMRLAGGLSEPTRNLLSLLAWGPLDEPVAAHDLARIARSFGYEPAETIAAAVAFGAIVPTALNAESLPLATRKKLAESGECENVGFVLWPALADRLPAPEVNLTGGRHVAPEPVRPSTPADMAEWAVRLTALWQSAMISPLRRTQSGGLHKKDRDLLLRDPVLAEAPADWPGGAAGWANWSVEKLLPIAVRLGLLTEETDSIRPVPVAGWADESIHLQERFSRAVTASLSAPHLAPDETETPEELIGPAPWLPVLLLTDLALRPTGEWACLELLLDDFSAHFAGPDRASENAISVDDIDSNDTVIVRTRSRKKIEPVETLKKSGSCAAALRYWLLGPARLAGLVDLGTAADGAIVVQATAQARFLTGQGPPPPPQQVIDKALFLQPNLEGILYRQAVTGQTLPRIATLLRFAGIGPVLQIRLDETWSRLMFGAGLAREEAQARLAEMSAVELSRTVLETYRTWAGKSDRVRVYGTLTLLETQSAEDRAALVELAASRNLRAFPIGDLILAIEDADAIPFDALRLLAQQDQTQKPAICVRSIEDGTLLEVDTARSDLALDPELARFARPVSDPAAASPWSAASRLYRIDRETLASARNAGVTETWLSRFFERRTGEPMPPALKLLWTCTCPGVDMANQTAIRIKQSCILQTESESILDGLMCLESTSPLITARLGPTAAEVEPGNVDKLAEIAQDLGIVLKS